MVHLFRVLLVVVTLTTSSTSAIGYDDQQQQHLRKPTGATPIVAAVPPTTTGISFFVSSFLKWPVDQLVQGNNRNSDNDEEQHHPLGSYYPRRRIPDDEIDPSNVIFSLTLSSKNSNLIRHRRKSLNRKLKTLGMSPEDSEPIPRPFKKPLPQPREYTLEHQESARLEQPTYTMDTSLAVDSTYTNGVHENNGGETQTKEEHNLHNVETHGDEEHGDEGHGDAHDLVVHVTYEDIYAILVFLLTATAFGIIASKLGMPALVGEIVCGFLLGPPLADFVPYPEALVLVGEIGLIMLLLEAGVELDVAQLRETGTRALAIGLTGTALPLLVGMGLAMASDANVGIKTALAVGASFSPTSLGVAASALKTGKMLDTPIGQLVVASCVVDDIMALILLSMFQVLVEDNPPVIAYFIPIISSLGFLLVLGGSAVTWLPKFIQNKILSKSSEANRELVMFSIMSAMLLGYLPLLYYTKSSYLTGAFLAGCTFSQIDIAHDAFIKKTHQLMTWLLRVFFAASIGFQVPVKLFGDPYVVGWGFILYLCVIAKLPLAFFVPQFEDIKEGFNPFLRDRIISGLSMTCRGEFSFIIAAFALAKGLINAKIYAAIVWAVLLSCISSPFILLQVIKYYNKKQADYLSATNPLKEKGEGDGTIPLYLHIKCKSPASWGLQEIFREKLNELGLEVMDRRTNRHGRGLNAEVQTDLYVRDKTNSVTLQKIAGQRRINRALIAAMDLSEEEAKIFATAAKEVQRCMKDGEMFFDAFDKNNDGDVSLKELKDGLESALKMSLTNRQAKKIMQLFDISGDRTLQKDEMVSFDEFQQRIDSVLKDHQKKASMKKKLKMSGTGFRRMSTTELACLSLQNLEKEEQDVLHEAAKEQDRIIKRGEFIEMMVEDALGFDDSEVVVDVWSPWPWTELLDKIAEYYELETVQHFIYLFAEIDVDGGGTIDQTEMFAALRAAGVNISEEGVLTLFKMIDEDGDGEINKDEWKETVEFYLELKKEEEQMAKERDDSSLLTENKRAAKLKQLGMSAQALTGMARRKKRTMSVSNLMSDSTIEESIRSQSQSMSENPQRRGSA